MNLNEVAPPTKKHERMVKHIKKAYKKDGKLTDDEKSIAYATAWKNYNKKESFGFEIDKGEHKKASKKAKMRNLAKGNTNPNEKAAAEKKAGGPKLYGEEENFSQKNKELKATKKARDERYRTIHSGTNTSKNTDVNEGKSFADWKKAAGNALKRKKEERKAQPATDAGARARRKLKDKEHNKYVNFLPAEDD